MLNYDYYSTMWMCIVIIPKIGRTLSILCSAFVAQAVLKFPDRHVKMTNRVILDLSISDIIFSTTCHIFRTWPVTQGLVYGSSENQGTCTAQGFLIMFSGWCAGLYSMTLAPTYLLQVRYEWSEENLRRYQPFFIFNPIFVGLVLATSIIPYSAYNYSGGWACEISASPFGCDAKDYGVDCIRGANTKDLRLFLANIPLILNNIVIINCMIILYQTVLNQELNIDRFIISGDQNRALFKIVAMQGIYFSSAYFLTWMFRYCLCSYLYLL